jgi:hypothetical protein
MKVYDDTLILAIWHKQLSNLVKSVLIQYRDGKVGLEETSRNYKNNSDINFCEISSITDKLKKPQLRRRIKRLLTEGRLKANYQDLTFFLDTEQAKNAHNTVRDFWTSKGVPKGFDIKNQCSNTTRLTNINELRRECTELIMKQFKQIEWSETYPK